MTDEERKAQAAKRQARRREKIRGAGLEQKQIWVHPSAWPAVRDYITAMNDAQKEPKSPTRA